MSTIEEQLWNYIDGNCSADEKATVEARLATDLQYKGLYNELLALNNEINKVDLDEPSMSFIRNVMEQVNLELKPVALKTKVNNRLINIIGAFFIVTLVFLVGYAFATSKNTFTFELPKLDNSFNFGTVNNKIAINIFLFIDAILALVYLDGYLRKGNKTLQKKGS
jgi:hypothetical protein